jgi:hypothetical protein
VEKSGLADATSTIVPAAAGAEDEAAGADAADGEVAADVSDDAVSDELQAERLTAAMVTANAAAIRLGRMRFSFDVSPQRVYMKVC